MLNRNRLSQIFCLFLFGGLLLLGGCAKKTTPQLGPKPTFKGDPASIAEKTKWTDDFRSWLQALSPQESKTLEESGQVTLTYEELKQSDPTHAKILEDDVAQMRARLENNYKAHGMELPAEALQNIKSVTFIKGQPGEYTIQFDFQDWNSSTMALSEPL